MFQHKIGLRLLAIRFLLPAIGFFLQSSVYCADLPTGFKESVYVRNLSSPASLSFSPDGRLFVLLQKGEIRVIKNGVLLDSPFLSVNVDSRGEHGLLGLAFDPDYLSNAYVYVFYTATEPYIHNRVSRFTGNGDVVVPGTEKILLELGDTTRSIYHTGGTIKFKDGKLYIGVGDHAFSLATANQLNNPYGKILRINPDGTIPSDNPFYNLTTGISRAIWAYGLRNPFTFDFQNETDRMYINDVGGDKWEEVNEGVIGKHYGWGFTEGYSSDQRFQTPVYAYPHGPRGSFKQGCAITGGAFYPKEGKSFPAEYQGQYFFLDYCNSWINVLNPETKEVTNFATNVANNPVDLKVGPDGNLYYLSRWFNAVYTIRYTPASLK
jgi:glucose/arabinose dehydrogenase